ncbi:MAG: hypothetical protein JSV88_24960 [Candidatus Aminicenantes bacterium]|nr:MAG: hypothetical protein JSV88_24960 [Candidatus Aminicenantes bacterium]
MRDDFSNKIKELLAKRVGYRCSNPDCRQSTCGPQTAPEGSINIGVAAHITAASLEGPRYDGSLNTEQRKALDNGIWLCQKCAKLIDSDEARYTVAKLKDWKNMAEAAALKELESREGISTELTATPFDKLETLMPDLLVEMREDLTKHPLKREFVLLKKTWSYWASGSELAYYYDDHTDLRNKIRILENYGLVEDITYNNVDRFIITEELADYLSLPN